jgi:hypothetical protein
MQQTCFGVCIIIVILANKMKCKRFGAAVVPLDTCVPAPSLIEWTAVTPNISKVKDHSS